MNDKERQDKINSYLNRIHDSRVKKCSKDNPQTREEFMNKLRKPLSLNKNFNTRPERYLEDVEKKRSREKILMRVKIRQRERGLS